jgi:hypothetical protein
MGKASKFMASLSTAEFYNAMFLSARAGEAGEGDDSGIRSMAWMAEHRWFEASRPFYNVWPAVLPMLLRLDLDKIQCQWVAPILPELVLRIPDAPNPLNRGPEKSVRTILVAGIRVLPQIPDITSQQDWLDLEYMVTNDEEGGEFFGILLAIDMGERENDTSEILRMTVRDAPRRIVHRIWLEPDKTVGEVQANIGVGGVYGVSDPVELSLIEDCMKLYCTLALLDKESELIDGVVFNADRRKYDETGNEKYVEKARRRGTVGWDIGRHVEVVPHYRRPHFGIRHTGPGRKIPRVRPIKGSIVHKKKIGDMPTGYLDSDTGETP